MKYEIAIVGGSGFVGSSLARHLSSKYRVKVLDNRPVSDSLGDLVTFELCDITRYDDVQSRIEDATLIIHTAVIQIPLINESKRLGYDVNVLGIQNVCEAVNRIETVRGALLTGSWHVFGERDFKEIVDEDFGYRPDKVESRARLYTLCKIAQETIMRLYDEMSSKIYGIVRIGTVLGEGMPEKTAANIFISRGLNGKPITPYKQSMYRPMLYVDVLDVCKAFESYVHMILDSGASKEQGSLSPIFNLFWPKPITIIELARIVKQKIVQCSLGKIAPKVTVIDTGERVAYAPADRRLLKTDIRKAKQLLDARRLRSPDAVIERVIRKRLGNI